MNKLVNGVLVEMSPAEVAAIEADWALGTVPTVPTTVTRRQAKQALAATGKLSLVQPAIDAIADPAQRTMIQIEWDDSQEFQRNRASVIGIGTAIGLSSTQLDELFTLAATL